MSLDDLNREQKRSLRRMGALDEQGKPTRAQRTASTKSGRVGPAQYLREVRDEMRKVAWPKRPEVIRYSIVVVITVVVYASLVGGLDAFHRQALEILRSDKTRNAFNLGSEPEMVRQRYGTTPFGQGALAARRLIEAGVRFTTISIGGWDTHGQNFNALRARLLPQLDQVLSALIQDLDDRGMLDSTIVYCAGEFNRTPRINGNAGRDHWARVYSQVLAGGGITRGQVYGDSDATASEPDHSPVPVEDYLSTAYHQLGINSDDRLLASGDRPIDIVRGGKVVKALIA